ncbi:hypothetical protein LTR36_009899 [Oleoguttula mirabilis]|uniref:Acyltransferase 3 domain-containing protein n=1 Tax=Oleoguttula mirabilis TaxID=1507867 RepID=A0AAV9J5A9_9PEZI|nr:hypothetical protein LTR36_009899 [Oleoguttula mirabilis]
MAVDEENVRREKPRPQWLTSVMPASLARKEPAANANPPTNGSPHDANQDYLTGLRGVLAIMSFLWVFMQTFAPAAVAHSPNDTGPAYQIALRKSLSVLFWNDSLIYSSIIFLSARTICLPFLLDSTKVQLASGVFRRGLRLWFPTAVPLIICYFVFTKTIGTGYLTTFANLTSNVSMSDDIYVLPSSLANFNSIFEIFWTTHTFSYAAGNWAFPTQTLWIVSVLFQQAYTVYATMVVIPYTRKSWRVKGAFVFIITAWWVYSWAWFSITGLLIADLVVNMDLKARCQSRRGMTLTVALCLMAAGFAMQFLWVTAYPNLYDAEIDYHTGLYNTGGVYTWNDATAPQLRADDYLTIVGFYILLESSDIMQKIFRNPVFVFLGKRSFAYFLLQSIIVYTLGIKTALKMMNGSLDDYAHATGVVFITTLLVTIAAGEVFYWLIEKPSQKFAHILFAWIRE